MLVALASCASSKSHPTNGKFEDCYYDCKPGQTAKADPESRRRRGLRRPTAGTTSRLASSRPLVKRRRCSARPPISSTRRRPRSTTATRTSPSSCSRRAELLVGPEALAPLAPMFREGAPPRVTTPTQKSIPHAAPQPKAVGSSEAEDEAAKVAAAAGRGQPDRHDADRRQAARRRVRPRHARAGERQVAAAHAEARVIEQRDREFLPHVMAVPVGSTVVVPELRQRVPQRVLDVAGRARSTSASTRPARRASTRSRRKASSGSAATCTRT